MSTLTLPRDRRPGTAPPAQGEIIVRDTEAQKARTRQLVAAAMADPAIRAAQARLVDVAVAFKDAGLYRDARTVLSTALTLALRHHFMAFTGRENPADLKPQRYAQRLRSEDALDRKTYQLLVAVCREPPPYGEAHVSRMLTLTRMVHQWTYAV